MRAWLPSLILFAGAVGCGGTSSDAFGSGGATDDASLDGAFADDVASDVGPDTAPPPADGAPADVAHDVGPVDAKDAGPICPPGSTSTPTKCPATCTGGCMADVCTVNCQGLGSCSNTTITCPLNMRCDVLCGGLNSCQNLRLFSAPTGALSVDCSGVNACTGINVACPAQASCDVQCIGTGPCTNGQVTCGAGACNAACSGLGVSLAKVNCGSSCRCANTCTK